MTETDDPTSEADHFTGSLIKETAQKLGLEDMPITLLNVYTKTKL